MGMLENPLMADCSHLILEDRPEDRSLPYPRQLLTIHSAADASLRSMYFREPLTYFSAQ